MQDLEHNYEALLRISNFQNFNTDQALQLIGELTDMSLDLGRVDGLKHAVRLGNELLDRVIEPDQRSILHYFLSNAWSNQRAIKEAGEVPYFDWRQEEIIAELTHLRKALALDQEGLVPEERVCQILTNLGNSMSHVGRFSKAIEYWDASLSLMPASHLARGNRALGIVWYAQTLYSGEHWEILLHQAHTELKTALLLPVHDDAKRFFDMQRRAVSEALGEEGLKKHLDLNQYPSEPADEDSFYLKWALENRLFLNPLNELGPYPIAAQDVLTLPSSTGSIRDDYNRLKIAYAGARAGAYELLQLDREKEGVNELIQALWGIFSATAQILSAYFDLKISAKNISLYNLWYKNQDVNMELLDYFSHSPNWSLRGIYSIGIDLSDEAAVNGKEGTDSLLRILKYAREVLLCLSLSLNTEIRLKGSN